MNVNDPLTPDDLDDLDPGSMSVSELKDLLVRLDALYESRQAMEPDEEDSEAFDEWEEVLEDIDDLIDDVRDRLDELE